MKKPNDELQNICHSKDDKLMDYNFFRAIPKELRPKVSPPILLLSGVVGKNPKRTYIVID